MRVEALTAAEVSQLEEALDQYDNQFIRYPRKGNLSLGIKDEAGELLAGLDATMPAFNILYVSIVFVKEGYRRMGFGKELMKELENRAKNLGANTIRLDTFDWQGYDFYKAIGYEEVGHYRHERDGYSEHFFVKFL